MTWHTVMINPRACCVCRRRVWRPWRGRTYLGMRVHARCARRQGGWLDQVAPFRVVGR